MKSFQKIVRRGAALLLALALGLALLPGGAQAAPGGKIDAAPCVHQWDAGAVTLAPTCTGQGVMTFACVQCQETKTQAIPKTGHRYDGRVVVKTAPTCRNAGSEWVYCSVCGDTTGAHTSRKIDPLPHTYDPQDPGVVVKEATCSSEGRLRRTCTVCKASTNVSLPKLPHTWDSAAGACALCKTPCGGHRFDVDGTCSTCGFPCTHSYMDGLCAICRAPHPCADGDKEILPPLAPTPSSPGLTEGLRCAVCGKIWTAQQEIPPLTPCSHEETYIKIIKEPTQCVSGQAQVICKNPACGQVLETRTIPRAHDWEERAAGDRLITICRSCGAVSHSVPLPAPQEPPASGAESTLIDEPAVPLSAAGLNTAERFAYITGYEDGTVRPLDPMTRAEAAAVFYRLMTATFRAASREGSHSFSDVDPAAWYGAAVSTCASAGIVFGYEDGSYRPGQLITRAEFTAFAAALLEGEDGGGTADFPDTQGHWAAPAIRRAVQAGWVQGSEGLFLPDEPITRAEAIAICNRMLGRAPDGVRPPPDTREWADNPKDAWYYADIQEATNGPVL